MEMKSENANNGFCSSKQLPNCLIEIFTMCLFTPPYLDYEFEGEMLGGSYVYSADSIISCIAFTRLVLVFKLYPHINKWSNRDVRELENQDQYTAMSSSFAFRF